MSDTEAIRFEGVTKRFGATAAVDDLDLTSAQGEFFSLLGPSGCGKTTTLRMVAGFEQPTEGRGLPRRRAGRRRAALQAQRQHGLPELRAVRAPRRRAGTSRSGSGAARWTTDEIEPRVARRSSWSSSPGARRRSRDELSGGQKQRVALARALVNRPAVLLLDEPLGALDLKLRKQMQVELKQIQREVGITFLYVTHDQEEALSMSDRIAVMDDGTVQQCGRARGRLRAPERGVRRRVHRDLEPAHGHRRGGGVRLANRRAVAAAVPDGLRARRRRSISRCARRRSRSTTTSRTGWSSLDGKIVEARSTSARRPRYGHRARRRRAGRRARAGTYRATRRRPLGARQERQARLAPRALPRASLT